MSTFHSILEPEVHTSEPISLPATQPPPSPSEEPLISPPVLEHAPPDLTVPLQPDLNSVVQSCNPASTLVKPAASVQAVHTNDSLFEGHHSDRPGPGDYVRQITQDDDLDFPVSDEIAHQLERIAEDSTTNEIFDRVEGHMWNDGLLMFRIHWKTDKISFNAIIYRQM